MAASTKEEADKIRQHWLETKMGQIGSPTVLPPRPDDSFHLPGSELAGFMPRRGDFDVEWENDAETALADMEFLRGDTAADKQLKVQVLEIYVQKLDAREKRKAFVLSRHLYDYRQYVQDEQRLPADERDLLHRMRLFERFHTPDEHRKFIADILHAKRLRKEIAKLQMYRRIGIRSLAEAEKYELDKNRYQFHKMAQLQRDAEGKAKGAVGSSAQGGVATAKPGASASAKRDAGGPAASAAAADAAKRAAAAGLASSGAPPATGPSALVTSQKVSVESLWKQYKTNDRKSRRRSTRSSSEGESLGGTEQEQDDNTRSNNNAQTERTNNNSEEGVRGPEKARNVDSDDGVLVAMETDNPARTAEGGEDNSDTAGPAEPKSDGAPEDDASTREGESRGGGEREGGKKREEGNLGASGSAPVSVKGNSQVVGVHEKSRDEVEGDFDISNSRGIDLLSKIEMGLCERLRIYPIQYLEIKKVLIHESLINGLLDKESSGPRRRTIVKIDIERRGDIIDFLVRAGWISRKLGNAAVAVGS
jgi:hypothetical protein